MKTIKYYAGIGSRETPANILKIMETIAVYLNNQNYILRSGGAIGADKAFESQTTNKEIFRPNDSTKESIALAMSLHPNPHACKEYVQKLHGRNAQILLGRDLNKYVDFVICYTYEGKLLGGTAMGIRIANLYDIPVYNLGAHDGLDMFIERFPKCQVKQI